MLCSNINRKLPIELKRLIYGYIPTDKCFMCDKEIIYYNICNKYIPPNHSNKKFAFYYYNCIEDNYQYIVIYPPLCSHLCQYNYIIVQSIKIYSTMFTFFIRVVTHPFVFVFYVGFVYSYIMHLLNNIMIYLSLLSPLFLVKQIVNMIVK